MLTPELIVHAAELRAIRLDADGDVAGGTAVRLFAEGLRAVIASEPKVPASAEELDKRLRWVVSHAGKKQLCKGPTCGQSIFWLQLTNGRTMPMDADGVPHWATCPDAETFKKKAKVG